MGIMCSNISEKFVTVYLIIADFSEIVTEPQPNIDIKLLINSVSLIFWTTMKFRLTLIPNLCVFDLLVLTKKTSFSCYKSC